MNLEDIAAISGKSGLFKILKPTRTGVIVESIDDKKTKIIITSNNKVTILKDVSIYSTGQEQTVFIGDIFMKMKSMYGDKLPLDIKSTDKVLKDTFLEVLPEYDEEKVYGSDIKKIFSWYLILLENTPEKFDIIKEEVEEEVLTVDNEEKPKTTKKVVKEEVETLVEEKIKAVKKPKVAKEEIETETKIAKSK